MNDETGGMHMHRRNTQAVEQKIREMDARLYEQKQTIVAQAAAIASAVKRIEDLERAAAVAKALATGHGPSVR